jgi:hypothetical protein
VTGNPGDGVIPVTGNPGDGVIPVTDGTFNRFRKPAKRPNHDENNEVNVRSVTGILSPGFLSPGFYPLCPFTHGFRAPIGIAVRIYDVLVVGVPGLLT